jgi:pimeloyl-ACP methyl ester carboxylesterase
MINADVLAALTAMSPADAAKFLIDKISENSVALPLRPQDAPLLNGTQTFRFGPDGSRCAWSTGRGPLVLLTHGWGGRGVQMAPLAHALAASGFRCVFFDAGGHGDSRREAVGFDTFISDAATLTQHVGEPVFAWIGHSAGGLGMMASRALRGVRAERYVCISTPRFPYVPLEAIKHFYGVGDQILDLVKVHLAAQFESDWQTLEGGAAYQCELASKLLLAYDIDDESVRHADADRIAERWPGATIVKTRKFGHNKILQSPEVREQTLSFLKMR